MDNGHQPLWEQNSGLLQYLSGGLVASRSASLEIRNVRIWKQGPGLHVHYKSYAGCFSSYICFVALLPAHIVGATEASMLFIENVMSCAKCKAASVLPPNWVWSGHKRVESLECNFFKCQIKWILMSVTFVGALWHWKPYTIYKRQDLVQFKYNLLQVVKAVED